MRIGAALQAAEDWRTNIDLHVSLGREDIADTWLPPARVAGYDFQPLRSVSEIAEEAAAMKNCVCGYGYYLARNSLRLWSIRKDGRRVATMSVGRFREGPLLSISELKAPANAEAPIEVWRAARQWVQMHDLLLTDAAIRDPVPLDRVTWISLWRPYWLAKRGLREWLPLAPSRLWLNVL